MVKTIKQILAFRKGKSKKENKLIEEAYNFAKKVHKGQKSSEGYPYFIHSANVSYLLAKWGQDYEIICVGLLHDVIEDCEISLETIRRIFGERIAFLIDGMSWFRTWNNKEKRYLKNWPESYKKFANYSKEEPLLVLIKLADMVSNIPMIHTKEKRKFIVDKSYHRFKSFWSPFLKEAGLSKWAIKIEREFNKYTKKRVKINLYNYISKKQLREIKAKLKKIEIIGELK